MATKVVATAFGGPEVLSLVEADVSAPAEGEVTVAVKAAAVNPVDYKIVSGAMGADPAPAAAARRARARRGGHRRRAGGGGARRSARRR